MPLTVPRQLLNVTKYVLIIVTPIKSPYIGKNEWHMLLTDPNWYQKLLQNQTNNVSILRLIERHVIIPIKCAFSLENALSSRFLTFYYISYSSYFQCYWIRGNHLLVLTEMHLLLVITSLIARILCIYANCKHMHADTNNRLYITRK